MSHTPSASPPAPRAILRGHGTQVHAAAFIWNNTRLVTGDAEGFVVLWDLATMRPGAVWRAHQGSILGVRGWGRDRIITHGRDHKLVVWRISREDEQRLSVSLPLEHVPTERAQPWILHVVEVNTMNFCSFTACAQQPGATLDGSDSISSGIWVAVPHTLTSDAIDIYALPAQSRAHTVHPGQGNGMAMSLSLFHHGTVLTVLAAFENGFASVHCLEPNGQWIMTYRSQAHSQPILSLDLHPNHEYFLTSAADSLIAKHPIPTTRQAIAGVGAATAATIKAWEHALRVVNTKHSGQQHLRIRSDGRIFATAGWDSNIRVYSTKTLKELAVLQWHKVGAYAVAFSDVTASTTTPVSNQDEVDSPLAGDGVPSPSSQPCAHELLTTPLDPSGSSSRMAVPAHATVKERRILQAQTSHWIAAGAKDGKVSLWDIY